MIYGKPSLTPRLTLCVVRMAARSLILMTSTKPSRHTSNKLTLFLRPTNMAYMSPRGTGALLALGKTSTPVRIHSKFPYIYEISSGPL